MESSSSASSSSFPASSSGRLRWTDLPIYESSPHYPPMDNGRLVPNASPSYSNYANYNYAGGHGGDGGGGSTADVAEKRGEDEGVGSESPAAVEREHMFDKVVTPSDVGKLNRLVIPKQHAERYFPLDTNSGDIKGLLLNFEDRTGKSWRFRYSYWNSSQSYVMTKGWSRFVKEKRLDAGDIVSFHRSAAKDQFYIDWRRRPDAPPSHHHHYPLYRGLHSHHHPAVNTIQFQNGFSLHRPIHPPFYVSPPLPPAREHHHHRGSVVGYNGITSNNPTSGGYGGNYGTVIPNFCHQTGSVIYLGAAAPPHQQTPMPIQDSQRDDVMVLDSVPVVHGGKAASKRLRLFGVNMDCTDENKIHHHHDLVLDSDRISSSSAESGLQLSLHGSGVAAASTSGAGAASHDFVDKGKSSMSLDLDI